MLRILTRRSLTCLLRLNLTRSFVPGSWLQTSQPPLASGFIRDLTCSSARAMPPSPDTEPAGSPAAAGQPAAASPKSPSSIKKRAAAKRAAPEDQPAADAAADAPKPSPARKKRAASPKALTAAAAKTKDASDLQVQDQNTTAAGDAVAAPADGAAAADAEAAAPAPKAAKKRQPKPKAPAGPEYHTGMRPPPCTEPCVHLMSWNVAGVRALLKKDPQALRRVVDQEQVDVLCLQEHKLQSSHVEAITREAGLEGWHFTWSCSQDKKGYAGTAVLCRQQPLSSHVGMKLPDHDGEGRLVTVEFPGFWLVNCYVPNSGDGLKRLDYRVGSWDTALAAYLSKLQGSKPVVLTGDLNCAHHEIDIHEPKRNLRSAGFTQEERDSFSSVLLGGVGLVDTFRAQHPGVVGYTYYSYRSNARVTNKGWRLDYFLVSSSLADQVHDSYILKEVTGSDHVPIGLVLKSSSEAA